MLNLLTWGADDSVGLPISLTRHVQPEVPLMLGNLRSLVSRLVCRQALVFHLDRHLLLAAPLLLASFLFLLFFLFIVCTLFHFTLILLPFFLLFLLFCFFFLLLLIFISAGYRNILGKDKRS